jgi:hypothetical protein
LCHSQQAARNTGMHPNQPQPEGLLRGRLRRCEACEWNNHSPRLAPCIHPEYAATYAQLIH